MNYTKTKFGEHSFLYSLTNDTGITLSITDFGARVVDLVVPLENEHRNIILGFDSEQEYREKDPYIGATIGRVAGRIKNGTFVLGKETYTLSVDSSMNHTLHGGPASFETKYWQAEQIQTKDRISVIFSYTSPENENGFPGKLEVRVTYSLTNQNEWLIDYEAKTDQPTVFNPTNHVYFNLTGDVTQTVAKHQLMVDADYFAVVADDTTVTGEKRDVNDTPFDFRTPKRVETVFSTEYEQNKKVNGLDHPFFLNTHGLTRPKAVITSPDQAVEVEMYTDQPAVVIFTAQFGAHTPEMRGQQLVNQGGLTLETQVSPGAIEFEDFGSICLDPGTSFHSQTRFKINRLKKI